MKTCEAHQADLVAFIRGELASLERVRLEAHLDRCGFCNAVEKKLACGLAAAKSWKPEADPKHLALLERRLDGYITPPRRRSFRFALVVAPLAATALLVLAHGLSPELPPEPAGAAHLAPASSPTPPSAEPPRPHPEYARTAITQHLHAISGDGWDGRISNPDPKQLELEMRRGFAVLAFKGGEGRKLTVVAPGISVEVIGTQFFVRVLDDGATVVGVSSGCVRVIRGKLSELVEAGVSRRYAPGRAPEMAPPEVAPEVDPGDAFLADHGHPDTAPPGPGDAAPAEHEVEASAERSDGEASSRSTRPRLTRRASRTGAPTRSRRSIERAPESHTSRGRELSEEAPVSAPARAQAPTEGAARAPERRDERLVSAPAREQAPTAPSERALPEKTAELPTTPPPAPMPRVSAVEEVLAEAERQARAGRTQDAMDTYRRALEVDTPRFIEHRPLFRYELGRLLAFSQRDPESRRKARAIFDDLARHASGEVQTQARFARCELLLGPTPCAASACLRVIAEDGAAAADVRAEARGLLGRWHLEDSTCPAQK